jgi:hypothetical protein
MWHDPLAPAFANALLNPQLPKPDGITGPNGKAADKRFNVYRNNVTYSLVEALGKNYPSVKAQCGDDKFSDAARLYLEAHPPRTKIMFQLGDNFANWLDQFAPAKAQMPWLADLARLECVWLHAYHVEDAKPLGPEVLSTISPDLLGAIRFKKHPAAAIIASHYAIQTMLEAGRNGGVASPKGAETVLTTRPQFAVETRVLSQGMGAFLDRLFLGQTLSEAAEAAIETDPSFDLSGGFGILLQSGASTALYR